MAINLKGTFNTLREAARAMLEDGRHALDEIARETGFGERERMRRSFVRFFGQPPQALRRAGSA